MGHFEELGDEAGGEEVSVAVGWTEEGGTGCRRAREGNKRGKGNTSLGHFLGLGRIRPQNRPRNRSSEMLIDKDKIDNF